MEMTMRPLGTILVAAEQTEDSAGAFVLQANPFLLHIYVASTLHISDEEATELAVEILGTSEWEKAILAMPTGQRALLPPPRAGVYLVVRRLEDAAALAITDFVPYYEVDWSKR